MMKSIKSDTETTLNRMDALEGKISYLETQVSGAESLSADVKTVQNTVSLLCVKLVRSEMITSRLTREVSEIKAHSMKYNLIFNFDRNTDTYKEIDGEDSIGVIKRFLSNVMNVPNASKMYIPVAHRLGKRSPGITRSILAKIPNANDLDKILKHTNRLKDTKHFVQKQLPPSLNERKQFAIAEFKEKRGDENNKARMVNEKLYIKGKLQTKYQPPELPVRDMSSPTDDIEITEGSSIDDSGSTFKGYAASATCPEDVTAALHRVIQLPGVATATHLIYAYRIDKGPMGITENFNSDGDHGTGWELLKHMRSSGDTNVLRIGTRVCTQTYSHIGRRRFEHLNQTTTEAVDELMKLK